MTLYLWRRVGAFLAVALLSAFWAQPISAFEVANLAPREVSASVVADADAYLAIAGGSCTALQTTGDTCTFSVTNKGAAPVTITVSKASDSDGRIADYAIGGSSSVTSGGVSTPTSVAVGDTVTVTATVGACTGCAGGTSSVLWDVSGSDGATFDGERTRYGMTLQFQGAA